jgi:hypothetical protein
MGGIGWIALAQNRDSWRALCECDIEPVCSIKLGEILDHLRVCLLSVRTLLHVLSKLVS